MESGAVLAAADPCKVVITREALRALHPRRQVQPFTLVLAVLLAGMRRQMGLTQKELALHSTVSFQEIGQLERGEHDTGMVTLLYLCKALHTPVSLVVAVAEEFVAAECLLS